MKPPLNLLTAGLEVCSLTRPGKPIPTEHAFSCSRTDTQGVVRYGYQEIWIGFRGTEIRRRRDILTDLDVREVPMNGGRLGVVHRGFEVAAQSVLPAVRELVAQASLNRHRIYLTGHSAGGALACISAWHLARSYGFNVAGVIAFGAPRWADPVLSGAYELKLGARTWLVWNHRDWVPRVPWALRWRHAGNLLYFDRAGRPHVNPERWRIASDRWKGLLPDLARQGLQGVEYHKLDQYQYRVHGMIQRAEERHRYVPDVAGSA